MNSRTHKSFFNFASGIISQLVVLLLPFYVRQVFLQYFGTELLGINSLLTSVIAMLNVADLGIGITIQIALYKQLALKNITQIVAITQICAKFYRVIASIIFVTGLLILPFMDFFVNLNDLTISKSSIQLYFLLFLINSSISYLFSYKWIIINADQNNYIISITNMAISIVTQGVQLVTIVFLHNFALYIVVNIVFTLTKNIFLSRITLKKYPFLNTKEKEEVDSEIKKNIVNNTKALLFHKIGYFIISGTNNILISKFVSLVSLGMYANYAVLISAVTSIISQFISSLSAGVGNLLITEESEHINLVFNRINFINFTLFNISAVGLNVFLNDVIILWLGEDYLLPNSVVIAMIMLFFHNGIRYALGNIRVQAGLFSPDRYLQIVYSVFNIVISIVLAIHMGIVGVIIGTLITCFISDVLVLPPIVYKNVMKANVRCYHKMYFSYWVTFIISIMVTSFLCKYVPTNNYILFSGIRFLICIFVPSIIIIILYFRSEPFHYSMTLISRFVLKL